MSKDEFCTLLMLQIASSTALTDNTTVINCNYQIGKLKFFDKSFIKYNQYIFQFAMLMVSN